MAEKKIDVFCANEQEETAHTVDIDGNGELVLTCDCGRFVKLPAGTKAKQLKDYVAAHKASNEGQRSIEALEAEKAALLADL